MSRCVSVALILWFTCSCGQRRPAPGNQGGTVIFGKISGSGSRPPSLARVDVSEPGYSGISRRIQAAPDGSYSISTSKTGLFRLLFTGALHDSYSVPLLIREVRRIEMDARIAPCDWVDKIEDVRVIGDFNDFSHEDGSVFMVKQPNGTFAAEFGNIGRSKMGYQLIGLLRETTRSVPGTTFDDLISDPSGEFVSMLNVRNGAVRVVFDPASLPKGRMEPGVTFADSESEVAATAALHAQMRRRQQEYSRSASLFRASGRSIRDFRYDWAKAVENLKLQLETEKRPLLRQMLYLSLLDLKRMQAAGIDGETASQALATIPPDGLVWELSSRPLVYEAIRLAGGLKSHQDYFRTVITTHPSRDLRAQTLEEAYGEALSSNDLARAKEYYDLLTTEYADLRPGRRLKTRPPFQDPGRAK